MLMGLRLILRFILGIVFLIPVSGFDTPLLAQTQSVPPTPFSTDVQTEWLHEVLPAAEEFGAKGGEPPIWPGYRMNPQSGETELVGYAFVSADVPPEEPAYSAPIDMLFGLDTQFNVTGVKLLDYTETYRRTRGDFLADYDFLSQLWNKPITDEFQIGADIDGVTGATVSVFAIARGARNASRRVAEAYLDYDPGDPVQEARNARIVESLNQFSWDEMVDSGLVRRMEVPLPDGRELIFSFAYLGHSGLGEFWIGADNYALAARGADAYLAGEEIILVAVGGSAANAFRSDQLQYRQEDSQFLTYFRRFTDRNFVEIGPADSGTIAAHADFIGAVVLPETVDITRPITLAYRQLGTTDQYSVEFQPVGLALSLAQGQDVLSAEEIEAIRRAENSWLNQLREDPPWGVTPKGKTPMLVLILILAMSAFLLNNPRLRWITLTLTVAYLGFVDGGFISISHLVNTMNQGSDFLLSSLPLLLFVIFTIVTTLLWGRIFCSSLCPFGAVQDFISQFAPKRWRRQVPQKIHDQALYIKYAILALIILVAMVASDVSIFQYFEPFGTLFFLNGTPILWLILIAFLAACFVVPRFYCRYACPLGAALGVVSLVSPLRIKRVPQCDVCIVCERACPTGAIRREQVDFKECVRCDICEIKLKEKAGACGHDLDRIIAATSG